MSYIPPHQFNELLIVLTPCTCEHMHASYQVFSVLDHVGVCVSYQAAWDYLRQLTAEARYREVVTVGHWLWVNDISKHSSTSSS